jgi:hypothetical protein
VDVGPRDGLQHEPGQVSTADKVGFVNRLAAAGVPIIEVGAFVSPMWVPQMADTAEVFAAIERRPETRCTEKLEASKRRVLPGLEDLEEQCEPGIEEVPSVLRAADAFGEVDLGEQQRVLDEIETALPEARRALVGEVIDLHTHEVWLQQEAAHYLGVAVGMRVARENPDAGAPDADEGEDDEAGEGLDEGQARRVSSSSRGRWAKASPPTNRSKPICP